jgi:hypothetical protein
MTSSKVQCDCEIPGLPYSANRSILLKITVPDLSNQKQEIDDVFVQVPKSMLAYRSILADISTLQQSVSINLCKETHH